MWTRSKDLVLDLDLEAVWTQLRAELAPAKPKGKSAKGKSGKKKKK